MISVYRWVVLFRVSMRGMEEKEFTFVLLCCVNVCIQAEMYTYFSKQNRLQRVLLAYIRRLVVVVVYVLSLVSKRIYY